MDKFVLTRREVLSAALLSPLATAAEDSAGTVTYLEGLKRPDGGYGWDVDPHSHLTPTFAVLGCYRLVGKDIPAKTAAAGFVREHYPMLSARHKDRPLRRFDYEQMQALAWLGEDISGFSQEVSGWTGPSIYTKAYEHEGYPVFQHEVMALLCRGLVGIPAATPEWRAYVLSRRRRNRPGASSRHAARNGRAEWKFAPHR
jgi:hypothetical protein